MMASSSINISIVLFCCMSFCIGYFLMLPLCNKHLQFKRREMQEYWHKQLEQLLAFKQNHHCLPSLQSGDRAEKELASWSQRQKLQIVAGNLSRDEVSLLAQTGAIALEQPQLEHAMGALLSEKELDNEYTISPSVIKRLMLGIVLTLVAILCCFSAGTTPPETIASLACTVVFMLIALGDCKVRLISNHLLLVLFPLVIAFALVFTTWQSALQGFALGIAIDIVLVSINKVMALKNSKGIGEGDLKIIPCLCIMGGFQLSVWGFFLSLIVMTLCACIVLISKKGNRKTALPYAYGFIPWYFFLLIMQVM